MGQASASHQQLVVCAFVLCCCLVTAKDGGQKEELGDWDYYARLGIPSTASAQEIKRAYHKQSIK
jgi:preprotein translocase subunit Sec63